MDIRLIFLSYHIFDGVTKEANQSQLVDFGLSTKRVTGGKSLVAAP